MAVRLLERLLFVRLARRASSRASAAPPPASAPARTHTCGELRLSHAGAPVALCGWVSSLRAVGDNLTFLTLRDAYGSTQVVASAPAPFAASRGLRLEAVVRELRHRIHPSRHYTSFP